MSRGRSTFGRDPNHKLNKIDARDTSVWEFKRPSKSTCAICGGKLGSDKILEVRITARNFGEQDWYYCPECWKYMQYIRSVPTHIKRQPDLFCYIPSTIRSKVFLQFGVAPPVGLTAHRHTKPVPPGPPK